MSENLHVVATIPTDPAQGDAVRAGLDELVAATRAEEGNVSYTCYESAAAPGTFVMVEEWASQEALDAHMTTPHMAKVVRRARPRAGRRRGHPPAAPDRLSPVARATGAGQRTRTTPLPRVRRSSMSTSARPKSSRSYDAPTGGRIVPASIIGTSSAHCCSM